jgi:starch synthase
MPRLRVLFVVSECVPIVKTGGLGDVGGALPAALARRGHDVRVLMPRYRAAKSYPAKRVGEPLALSTGAGERWTAVFEGELPGKVPIYLLEHDVLFDRNGIYGDDRGDFGDNLLRFSLLSQAAVSIGDHRDFHPDVIHVNDWQTSLVPAFLRKRGASTATVLSIHNLGYQGRFPGAEHGATGLSWHELAGAGFEHFGAINLLKGGISSATLVSTVSPRYAGEIQTPEGGAGLDGTLRARGNDVVGILNGIDEAEWDPRRDRHLPAHYGPDDMAGKAICKAELQRELGLPVRDDVPLVGMVTRFAHQKGIDVFAAAVERLLWHDVQFAVLGAGESWAEELFSRLSVSVPTFRARIGIDERMAHRIEAGADLFVMPSRYEPCGLNQMYSQRYGTLPIVRGVGGLLDTVDHDVTGFVFHELSGDNLAGAIQYAADVYRNQRGHFRAMQQAAMQKPLGWDRAASQYEALYRWAMARR